MVSSLVGHAGLPEFFGLQWSGNLRPLQISIARVFPESGELDAILPERRV
jgi:hypothetical protein